MKMIISQIKIYEFDGKTPKKIEHWPINYTFVKNQASDNYIFEKNDYRAISHLLNKLALGQLHICKIKWPSRPITYL